MINPGQYKARGIKGSMQVGESEGKGTLQIAINLDIKTATGVEQGTTFLFFSEGAAPYAYERLRALGWKGKGPDEIDNPDDISANEVDVRVTVPEQYTASDGTKKMGVSKIEILTGAGTVTLAKPLDMATFKARLKAIGGGGSSAPAGGGSAPPF